MSREIQLCQLHDAESVYAVMECHRNCFFDQSVNRKLLAEKIAENGFFVTALINEKTAGFVGFYANDRIGKTAYLTTIVVDNTFQGMGIGSILVRECLKIAAENGMEKCWLEVDRHNEKAIRFYNRLGFSKRSEKTSKTDLYERSIPKETLLIEDSGNV